MIIVLILKSWAETILAFLQEAGNFYWRLLTNRAGLPKWLWVSILLSCAIIVVSMVVHDVFMH